ncbi:zona pellucida sperm-binding protein 3-like isoform X2 [Paroedura picta]|uniref:zona pellucida sperm-binding protein 3-like isoform X2 n=1 Tax=Paroedura picta TaxID=143630 RepID=UPI004055CD6F
MICLLAVQVLTQGNDGPNPTVDSSSYPGITAKAGFFRRVLNVARGLVSPVWHDASTTMNPTTPGSQSANPPAQFPFVQESQLKQVSQMNFSLRVLEEYRSFFEESGLYDEGSPIYIEARVQTPPGVPLPKIFIDECYGTDTEEQIRLRKLYVIADNHGCLYHEESETVTSWFRKEDSAIVFTVPAFLVSGKLVGEIYIHCLLSAWSQNSPTSSGKKTCYFNRTSSSWKNIDDPSKSSVCNCCDSFCPMESPHRGRFKASFVSEGRLHREVAGPLTVLKDSLPWFYGQCHTIKSLLLMSLAFLGSFALVIFFIGVPLGLTGLMIRHGQFLKGHRLLVNKVEQDFDTELKTVARALAAEAADEMEESTLDYDRLKEDSPEKDS